MHRCTRGMCVPQQQHSREIVLSTPAISPGAYAWPSSSSTTLTSPLSFSSLSKKKKKEAWCVPAGRYAGESARRTDRETNQRVCEAVTALVRKDSHRICFYINFSKFRVFLWGRKGRWYLLNFVRLLAIDWLILKIGKLQSLGGIFVRRASIHTDSNRIRDSISSANKLNALGTRKVGGELNYRKNYRASFWTRFRE